MSLLLGLLPLSACVVQLPLTNILAPLIAWFCVRKDNPESKSAFQGVMNMQISWTLYCIAGFFVFGLIGLILLVCTFSSLEDTPCSVKMTKMTKVTTCCNVPSNVKETPEKQDIEEGEEIASSKRSSEVSFHAGKKGKIDLFFPWGEVKIHSDSGDGKETRCELKGFPFGAFGGIFVVQIVMIGVMALFVAGGIAWLVLTIIFAVKVKDDANAKPPLSIRFLK